MNQYTQWLERDPDPKTRQQLQQLISDDNQVALADCFNGRLAFGTAGLRGIVGCGPNRMNRLVIQETATGLGNYLIEQIEHAKTRGVVVGYDGRLDSQQFAYDTAAALNALGIKVYLTYQVAATPVVAYGIKTLNAAAAVVVTASHNPPEYNGFKVYWQNGAQIIAPHDSAIAEKIAQATTKPINLMSMAEAEDQQLLHWLEEDYYQRYRQEISHNPLFSATHSNSIAIAYTAMHGVGANLAETLLADAGFTRVHSVAEQRDPDGTFPTVNFPNPEEAGAMDLVIALATATGSDLACANDPDADRFAVAARHADGKFQMLTGDQVGALLADYLLSQCEPNKQLLGNSIVSSRLLAHITQASGATYYQTLTGFKWLANIAMEMENDKLNFLFAYEEALGYTVGDTVRDKDGLSTLVIFALLTEKLKQQNRTVFDQLETIYRQHGLFVNRQRSLSLDANADPIGDKLRENPPKIIAGSPVVLVEDLKTSCRKWANGEHETIDLPSSDVLIYHLEDQSRIIVRPSGTEPKLKCYYEVICDFPSSKHFEQVQTLANNKMDILIEQHQAMLS